MSINPYSPPTAPLASVTEPGRRPWSPSGFFCRGIGILLSFGAIALVSAINLRRLGNPQKAAWVMAVTCCLAMVLGFGAAVFESSTTTGMIVNVAAAELLRVLQERDFSDWKRANPETPTASAWSALGWGVLGLVLLSVLMVIGSAAAVFSGVAPLPS